MLDSGTLSPLLKRLEAAGLLTRRRDPADERSVLVRLTAAGDDLRHEAAERTRRTWPPRAASPRASWPTCAKPWPP